MLLSCGTVCGGGVQEGTMALPQFSAGFQSFPPFPTSKLGPSGADSQVGDFVYVLGPCGSLQGTLLWGWGFFLLLQPPQVFSVRVFEALFPLAGTLGCSVCVTPQLFLPVYLHANVGLLVHSLVLPGLPVAVLPGVLSTLAACLCPSYWPGWMFLNSLVVSLPYSSIFCQFLLFFVFKFVVVLLFVV